MQDYETRPYDNEHACTLDTGKFPKIRRKNGDQKKDGKPIDVVYGISGPGKSKIISLRFKIKHWKKSDARKVCNDRGGKFEPAKEKKELEMEQEKRTLEAEWRVEKKDGKPIKLIGYAAVFDVLSLPMRGLMKGFREKVKPGAFTKSLAAGDDVRALVDHNPSSLLGRRSSGTLKVSEDKKGLQAEIDLPDTTLAADTVTLIERGDLSGMSVGFRTITDAWHVEDELEVRELIEIKLFDVSVATFPAYPETDVAVRSHDKWEQEQEQKQEQEQGETLEGKSLSTDVARRRLALNEIE